MDTNSKYDNKFSDTVLVMVGTIVRTLERAVVVFFDGLRRATEHGSPSMLGFVSAVLPMIAPLPIAWMTAHSLMTLQGWDLWQAVMMAATIEGAGFVLWVSLVETLIADGWNGTIMQWFFALAVFAYESLLIMLNAVLARADVNGWVLILECLFPALCAIAYGYRNHSNKEAVAHEQEIAAEMAERERQEALEREERIRQEKREDRFRLLQMKQQYAKDVNAPELEKSNGKKFRGGK